ncbi:MAG: TatD family hydrolase [Myxococcales bacterium]|nr:TatD family hydrolase [Myxococcota bacterium]MDW8282314.1 TatD family hydrolase [Myxococcales bacterium]
MFDSHCHLHDGRMDQVREAALARARAAGVQGMLLAGVEATGWAVAAALVARDPDHIAASYGVHPQMVPSLAPDAIAQQLELLSACCAGRGPLPRPAAIGELGLDAGCDLMRASLPAQERVFREQLALARQHDLPVVLHVLRAHSRVLALLRADGVPACGGVVHSYSGGPHLVADYLALGLCLSFAGPVTYPGARRVQQAARAVPQERLLVETDAPDQTPAPHRPGPNEPACLPAVVAALATIRGEDPLQVARYTEDNARRLFRLPRRA